MHFVQPKYKKSLVGYFSSKIVMVGIKILPGIKGLSESSKEHEILFGLHLVFVMSSRILSSLKLMSYIEDLKTASQIPSNSS